MANLSTLLVSAAACLFLCSCQSAPPADSVSLEKHEAELQAAAARGRELQGRLGEAERERDRLAEALKAAENGRSESKRTIVEYEKKLADSERRLKALEDENVRISATLDELNFARIAGLMTPREAAPIDRPQQPAGRDSLSPGPPPDRPAGISQPPSAQLPLKASPTEMSGVIAVKAGRTAGTRYYDAGVNPAAERVLCLFALESEDERVSLWLHYGASMPAEEARGASSITLIADGTALPLPFPESALARETIGRLVRESIELEVTAELWRFTRSLLAAESVKIVHRSADSARERMFTNAERRAMGNVLYAYRELGGILP